MYKGLIEKYRKYLPVSAKTPIVSLNEGNTPLIEARNISDELGLRLFFKYEGLNPTGSFKDRGMTMAVSKALEEGSNAIMCASTGNTSASAAAYAARAGIRCIVIIPNNKIALGKLAQASIYGAEIIALDGNFDEALNMVREITSKSPVTLVNSINPFRLEGQKTGAFEVCDQLEEAPDYLAIPVGNAGNISAYWMGFKEYRKNELIRKLPKMLGFQAEGAAPIVDGKVFEHPETIATAIRIGNPASWEKAKTALVESEGKIDKVSDEEILSAQKLLASKEGIFAEPASCASLAGVIKLSKEGYFNKGDKVVCVLTGNGLKDPNIVVEKMEAIKTMPVDVNEIEKRVLR